MIVKGKLPYFRDLGTLKSLFYKISLSLREPNDVLIQVEYAGLGEWDTFERKGGYAEYVALNSNYVSPLSNQLTLQKASSISGVGLTALRGLEAMLKIKQGESVMIFGASGGVGHLAVQLAKSMGVRVFAVASGQDGVTMVKGLGIDVVIDGREDNLSLEAHSFAPEGFDAALLTAGGESTQKAIECVSKDGRIAFPNGIDPVPQVRTDIESIWVQWRS